jgi:hypothetical protein
MEQIRKMKQPTKQAEQVGNLSPRIGGFDTTDIGHLF